MKNLLFAAILCLGTILANAQKTYINKYLRINGTKLELDTARNGTGWKDITAGSVAFSGFDTILVARPMLANIISLGGLPYYQISTPLTSASDTGLVTPTMKSLWDGKQAALVNQTNIKSINGTSLLGSGDLVVSGGGSTLPSVTGQTGKLLSNNGTSALWFYGPNYFTNVKDYGAVADFQRVADGATTGGSNVLTSATANFVSGDVGKTITTERTGSASADQTGTIVSVTNSTTVVLSYNAVLTTSSKKVYWGTDNTTAVRNAVAAAAVGGIVRFPEGKYFIQDTISIAKTLTIQGAGGAALDMLTYGPVNWTNGAATTIATTKGTVNLFSVNAMNVSFKDIGLEQFASDLTSGSAGIMFYHGQNFKLNNMIISGFYNDVNMYESYFWVIDGVFIDDFKNAGVIIQNEGLHDAGDWSIANSFFYGGSKKGGGSYAIYHLSSGGGKVVNCKFNALLPNTPQYMYYGNVSGTVDLQFVNNSFENYDSSAIYLTSPANFYNATITGNQFAAGRASTKDVVITNSDNLSITGNVFAGFNSTSQALVVNGQKTYTSYNTYAGYTGAQAIAPLTTSYSNSITGASDVFNYNTSTSAHVGATYSMTGATNAAFFDYYPSNYDTTAYQNMTRLGTKLFGASVEMQTGAGWQVRKIGATTPTIRTFSSSGNVGINAASDVASALLQMVSTSKGFLPPAMTNAQMVAISSPAEGLVVYDLTNHFFNVYSGSGWVALGSGAGVAWGSITGTLSSQSDLNTALGNKADKSLTVATQSSSYTAVLGDAGTLVRMNNASANNFTVPLNSSVAYPVGTQITVVSVGAGQTTIVATGGVTINSAGGALKLRVQYSAATLIKTATDTWLLSGDITL